MEIWQIQPWRHIICHLHSPPTPHNDASRIRYDLTPYSLLYIIQMDFPDIITQCTILLVTIHLFQNGSLWRRSTMLCCVCCDIFRTIFDMVKKYQCVVICAFRGATCSSAVVNNFLWKFRNFHFNLCMPNFLRKCCYVPLSILHSTKKGGSEESALFEVNILLCSHRYTCYDLFPNPELHWLGLNGL